MHFIGKITKNFYVMLSCVVLAGCASKRNIYDDICKYPDTWVNNVVQQGQLVGYASESADRNLNKNNLINLALKDAVASKVDSAHVSGKTEYRAEGQVGTDYPTYINEESTIIYTSSGPYKRIKTWPPADLVKHCGRGVYVLLELENSKNDKNISRTTADGECTQNNNKEICKDKDNNITRVTYYDSDRYHTWELYENNRKYVEYGDYGNLITHFNENGERDGITLNKSKAKIDLFRDGKDLKEIYSCNEFCYPKNYIFWGKNYILPKAGVFLPNDGDIGLSAGISMHSMLNNTFGIYLGYENNILKGTKDTVKFDAYVNRFSIGGILNYSINRYIDTYIFGAATYNINSIDYSKKFTGGTSFIKKSANNTSYEFGIGIKDNIFPFYYNPVLGLEYKFVNNDTDIENLSIGGHQVSLLAGISF